MITVYIDFTISQVAKLLAKLSLILIFLFTLIGVISMYKKEKVLIKSVRLDLSSIETPDDYGKFASEVLNKLSEAGANTIFVNPWGDGYANYKSKIVPKNSWGENDFLETLIEKSHKAGLKVFAWFVVGKDDFPAQIYPEWFAKTINGKNYYHQDEPGILLPVASLANDEYLAYHLSLLREVNQLPIDGWVISEPIISWADRFDPDYADFSSSVVKKFKDRFGVDPRDQELYPQWVNFRANIVNDFVRHSLNEIRKEPRRPIVITVFTEPKRDGQLKSLSEIKSWLGEDINSLVDLNPDYLEIQDLFADFEFPQKPEWTKSMINQFRSQLSKPIPLMVSIQGFNVEPIGFFKAVELAMKENVAGVSFYAFHTLSPQSWEILSELWR